jgi:hypothetical protein
LKKLSKVQSFDIGSYRAFICHTLNECGYPAKDRSRRLQAVEEPHLGKLMTKISQQTPINNQLNYQIKEDK